MTGFRGSDASLDREIATLERMARIRVRRVASELSEIDRDLRELRRERARRKAEATEPVRSEAAVPESA